MAGRSVLSVGTRVALLVVWAFPVQPALAQLACGAVIGPGEKVTLTENVGPCTSATDPAFTVIGPATFDLAGFRVQCEAGDRPTGIGVEGKGAKVLRGGIHDCDFGLDVAGEGKHKFEDLLVTGSAVDGISIDSDKNKLKRVASLDNVDDGFRIGGKGNKVDDAEAVGNGTGFEVEGNGHKFGRVVASGNDGTGLFLVGDDNKVKDCRLTANTGDGAFVSGNRNTLDKCLAAGNGDGAASDAGFDVTGVGHEIKKSQALDNDEHGVRVGGANHTLKQITSLGHDELDMLDQNGNCGTNTWTKNTFGTSNAGGVVDAPCIE